jgi:hypothetical protein
VPVYPPASVSIARLEQVVGASGFECARQASGFGGGYLATERRDAVVAPAFVRLRANATPIELADETIVQQTLEVTIQSAGKHPHVTCGTFRDVPHHRVAVTVSLDETEEDFEDFGL